MGPLRPIRPIPPRPPAPPATQPTELTPSPGGRNPPVPARRGTVLCVPCAWRGHVFPHRENRPMQRILTGLGAVAVLAVSLTAAADDTPPEGFTSLFNGKDFTGWKVPAG